MPKHCCVPCCTNNESKNPGLAFHTFPQKPDTRKSWIVNIRRDVGPLFQITKATYVCGEHFQDSDYTTNVSRISEQYQLYHGKPRKRLKADAVPTVFQWKPHKQGRRKILRRSSAPADDRQQIPCDRPVDVDNHPADMMDVDPEAGPSEVHEKSPDKNSPVLGFKRLREDSTSSSLESPASFGKEELKEKNIQLLTLRAKEKFGVTRFVNDDQSIKYYTGFPLYATFHAFYEFLTPDCAHLHYIRGHSDTSKVTAELPKMRLRTLNPLEEFFLVLVRLRRGLPEKVIGDMYSLSESHISRIINTWLLFLSNVLQQLPIWPSADHVKNTAPLFFSGPYQDVRIIIDCTEIFIEHPSSSTAQKETFSSYKHHNTVKGLVGIAPSGQITFYTPLYSGRCSDKKIVRHCGLLDKLQEGDTLMADRGFDIEKDCTDRKITLVIPAFLGKNKQFTPQQVKESRQIASLRVHVERAIRRIKEYNILTNIVPITLTPMLDHIWIVCNHLANFSGTIYKQ